MISAWLQRDGCISLCCHLMIVSCAGTDRPALKYLNRHVREYITDKWYDIGLELFDVEDESILNTIKNNNFRDSKDCTTEMLRLWLERKPDASWNQLLQALKAPNIKLETLASKIEGMLNKGNAVMHTRTNTHTHTYIHD